MSSANLHALPSTVCPSGLRERTQVPLAQVAWAQNPQLSFFFRQASPEDVAFALAMCGGRVQHTCSPNLNMITTKTEALQQDRMSELLRRFTRKPLGSARSGSIPLAVVLVPKALEPPTSRRPQCRIAGRAESQT